MWGNGTGAEFLAARKGMVGYVPKLFGCCRRHAGTRQDRSRRYTLEAPGLKIGIGGWVSVKALLNRIDAIYGVRKHIHVYSAYFVLGVVWGVPQVRLHGGFVTAPGRHPSFDFIRAAQGHSGATRRSSPRPWSPPLWPSGTELPRPMANTFSTAASFPAVPAADARRSMWLPFPSGTRTT